MSKASEEMVVVKDGERPVSLKTERFKLDQLPNMLPVMSSGRFADVKINVKQRIAETPVGEYFTVAPSKKMLSDKKERAAFNNAVTGMMKKAKLPWVIRWTPVTGKFLVVREKDWSKAKSSGAKP